MSRAAMAFLGACALLFGSPGATAAPEEPPGWGTASPTVLEYASPTADVIVMCQARADTNGDGKVDVFMDRDHGNALGDAMRPYLCVGPGPGEEIDEFVAGSPSGRHVVVIQKRRLLLVDAVKRTRLDLSALGADDRDHGVSMWPHRAAVFDATGKRVAWTRKSEKGHGAVVIRDLATGAEVVVEAGPVLPMSIWFDEGGRWLWMHAVVEDTDKDGVLAFPHLGTSLGERACRGGPASYSTFGWTGDRFERYVVPVAGGTPRPARGAFEAVGPVLLRRKADGALWTGDPAGKELLAVPGEAAARVIGIWRAGGVAVLEDTAGAHRGRYRRWSVMDDAYLDLSRPETRRRALTPDDDQEVPSLGRYWRVHSHEGPHLVDLFDGATREFPRALLTQHGSRLLLETATSLAVFDAATGADTPLEIWIPLHQEYAPLRQQGARVLHRGLLIDLVAGRSLGTCPDDALALAQDGRVLMPPDATRSGLVQGPLRWTVTTPRPTSGAPGAGK